MSDEPYEPFDQEAKLPPPPWSPDDPALKAWEAAHGHDVRLKCYAEFGCLVIEEFLEREVARLESQNQALQERIEDVLLYLDECENGLGTPSGATLRQLLSPTQETDPPDVEEIARSVAREWDKTLGVLSKRFLPGPTQETDPG